MLTMSEHSTRPAEEISFAYCGDARNNVGNSLLVAGAMTGMDVRIVAPQRAVEQRRRSSTEAEAIAAATGARLTHTDVVAEGVAGADFVYTDVWVSMGEPKEVWDERIALLKRLPGEHGPHRAPPAARGVRFMHCLPAFHDRHTTVGEEILQSTGMDGARGHRRGVREPHSIVFDQAENRLHTIKAILVATLGD